MKKNLSAIFFSLVLCSCATMKTEKVSLNGMVYDFYNEPVQGASVFVDGKEYCRTDVYGHFTIENKKSGFCVNLVVKKQGYETVSFTAGVSGAGNLAYIKMYSQEQLLYKAESLFSDGAVQDALSVLEHASEAGADTLSVFFHEALILCSLKEYKTAEEKLLSLLELGFDNPYIYLLLADIYQYGYVSMVPAKNYLKEFLSKISDSSVQLRYDSL